MLQTICKKLQLCQDRVKIVTAQFLRFCTHMFDIDSVFAHWAELFDEAIFVKTFEHCSIIWLLLKTSILKSYFGLTIFLGCFLH